MELLELLDAQDVSGFNVQRRDGTIDLFAAELAGKKLDGADFSNAILDKADLTGTFLRDARLFRASIEDADAEGVVLERALAQRIRLRDSRMAGAKLQGADMTEADLTGADLTGCDARGVRIVNGRMKGMVAPNSRWAGADMSEAGLKGANLSGADLTGCDLTQADLTDAKLVGARLDGTVLLGVRMGGADLSGASLVGCRMQEADLHDAKLGGANLMDADLTRANLTRTQFAKAKMGGVILAEAVLDGADLTGVDLVGVDLSGVDVSGLPLSESQRLAVGKSGVVAAPDAAWVVTDPVAAACGSGVVVVWENVDGPDARSVRWTLSGKTKAGPNGTLQVPASAVLARFAVPLTSGAMVGVIWARPGGVAVTRYVVGPRGAMGPAKTSALGWTPGVRPAVVSDGKQVFLLALTREGPGIVVHRMDMDNDKIVHSSRLPTARGTVGRHQPIVVCKGGSVVPVDPKGAQGPRRAPAGFDETKGTAGTRADGSYILAWVVARKGTISGGIRYAALVGRGDPEVLDLTRNDAVESLDAIGVGAVVWLAWVEHTTAGTSVFTARLPEGSPVEITGHDDAASVRWASSNDEQPLLLVLSTTGKVSIVHGGGGIAAVASR